MTGDVRWNEDSHHLQIEARTLHSGVVDVKSVGSPTSHEVRTGECYSRESVSVSVTIEIIL